MTDPTPEENAEEAEIVLGRLDFTIDGTMHHVPELKWRANRKWHVRMQEVFASLVGVPSDTPDGQEAMADAERQLVLAYDETHALGDLEDATEREVGTIYERLIEVSFPQTESRTAVMVMLVRQAIESAQENSTSGPLPTGTSEAPTILKDHLRSAKSPSSTRRRKSASPGSSATA